MRREKCLNTKGYRILKYKIVINLLFSLNIQDYSYLTYQFVTFKYVQYFEYVKLTQTGVYVS